MKHQKTILGLSIGAFFLLALIAFLLVKYKEKITGTAKKALSPNTKPTASATSTSEGGGGGSQTTAQQLPATTLNSSEVKQLQIYLNSKGENLATDGIYGNLTASALKRVTGKDTITSQELKTLIGSSNTDTALAVPYDKVKNTFYSNVEYSEINTEGVTSHKVANPQSTVIKKYSKGVKVYPTGYTIDTEKGNEGSRWVELKDGSWIFGKYLTSKQKSCAWYDLACQFSGADKRKIQPVTLA